MNQKKTFFNWLTNRYIVVIRNEENFAEKTRFVTNYARLTVLSIFLFVLISLLSFYLVRNVMVWFNPYQQDMELINQVARMTKEKDSLLVLSQQHAKYNMALQRILEGDTEAFLAADSIIESDEPFVQDENVKMPPQGPIVDKISKEFEEGGKSSFKKGGYGDKLANMYFYTPINGIITQGFNVKKGQYGVKIAAKEDSTVHAIADGTVVFATWSEKDNYVIGIQHNSDIISVYKNNSLLLRRTGDFVRGGEALSFSNSSLKSPEESLLKLEIWYNGNPVNPEHLINF